MRSAHDMGGLSGGPIDRNEHAPEFFEKRVDAIVRLLRSPAREVLGIDELRRGIESLPDYAQLGYYSRWIRSVKLLLLEKGVLTEEEIARKMIEIRSRQPAPK
ncbi:MAG: nitrile hydratase subunit beta [Bacteroidetes bacterium]|nr:nitrile hydratase subunit beta [Bacteroidota bacterium]